MCISKSKKNIFVGEEKQCLVLQAQTGILLLINREHFFPCMGRFAFFVFIAKTWLNNIKRWGKWRKEKWNVFLFVSDKNVSSERHVFKWDKIQLEAYPDSFHLNISQKQISLCKIWLVAGMGKVIRSLGGHDCCTCLRFLKSKKPLARITHEPDNGAITDNWVCIQLCGLQITFSLSDHFTKHC